MTDLAELPSHPLVSIIVPSFNQGQFIERTLQSIIRQDYRPIELIVVDGASTDDTVSILRRYSADHSEIRWVSEPDDGPASAVNKGLAMAQGAILGIQSSDDMYYAGAIEAAVSGFAKRPECGLIYGDSDSVDTEDCITGHYVVPEFSWPALFAISMCLPQQSIFFRADLAHTIEGWNHKYYGCDLDYWMRLMLRAPAVKVPFVFSAWRSYPQQRTQPEQYEKIWRGYWEMIADCRELANCSPKMKRMARASCHLMALRYHPTRNVWVLRWHAFVAAWLFPGFLRYCPPSLVTQLIPGIKQLRRLLRRKNVSKTIVPGPKVDAGGLRPTL